MKQKIRLGECYALTKHKLKQFIRWQALCDTSPRKAETAPCSSPPPLTLPSGPIPMCPAYTSKGGTLAKGKRLYSGRKADSKRERVRQESDRDHAGDYLKSALEISEVRRRDIEESCVCTHAKAPARSGLGLALGLVVLLFLFCGQYLHAQGDSSAKIVRRDSVLNARVEQSAANLSIPEGGVIIGDSLPEWFWELELNVVNHPEGETSVRLEDYRDRMLVLDFWANYCKPCVKSVEKWNELQPRFEREVSVLLIHLFYPTDRAEPFVREKGWTLPTATGNKADTILNKLFFFEHRFGQVWIKNGKLLAIPKNDVVSADLVARVTTNREVNIEMEDFLTYFDSRRTVSGSKVEPEKNN